jgi:hypothetical protein
VRRSLAILAAILLAAIPGLAMASGESAGSMGLITHPLGFLAIGLFVFAYVLVMGEEFIHLRKSKPVILAEGLSGLLLRSCSKSRRLMSTTWNWCCNTI